MVRFLRAGLRTGGQVFLLLCISHLAFAQENTVAYWNFNDNTALLTPNIGLEGAAIVFEPASGSEAISGTGQDFFAENALNGDPVGAHLRVNLPIGSKLYFDVPTTGFSDIIVKYETRRSGSGAGTQHVSYSIDGTTFTAFTTTLPPDGTPEIVTLDFSDIEEVSDNPNFRILIEFSEAPGSTAGNNRFDNVTVRGTGGAVTPSADIDLVFPRNKSTNVSLRPTFRWSGEAAPYTLQLSDTKTFDNVIHQADDLADTVILLTTALEAGKQYFWRVGVTIDDEWVFSAPNELTTQLSGDQPKLSQFFFDALDNAGKLHGPIVGDIYGDSLVIGLIPAGVDVTGLIAGFAAGTADSVTVGDLKQESQWSAVDFSIPVVYSLHKDGSVVKSYTVKLVTTGLPVIYINTDGNAPIVSKDDYVTGKVKIVKTDGTIDLEANTDIRGRGNSTWSMPKKPYRMKLNSKASVLGNPADRDWVLLANYADKTLMRTSLAFALGQDFGLEWNNRTQPVELVINGVHQGSYLLGEHVKVAPDRVNVTELSEDDEDDDVITGGYFLEIDARLDEDYWFHSSQGVPFTIKAPEDITTKQFDYIKNYINEIEAVLNSPSFADPVNGYAKYIDTESFIKWYWVNELLKNNDARFFSSVFMYKERNEKLKMGPLWDFDIAAGNIYYNGNDNPNGWWIRSGPWFNRLMTDPVFLDQVNEFCKTHRPALEQTVMDFIDTHANKLTTSQDLNFMKWPILDTYVWPNAVVTGSYEGEVNYLKSWMKSRIKWIDSRITPDLHEFELASPFNESIVLIDKETDSLVFRWTGAGSHAGYKIKLDYIGGSSAQQWSPGTLETDTTYTLKGDQLWTLLDTLGVDHGDTLNLSWHVEAILYDGDASLSFESAEAFNLQLINTRIPSPGIVFPAIGEIVPPSTRVLQWKGRGPAEGFIVQLCSSPDFDDESVVLSEFTTDTTQIFNVALRSLQPYYWRVMSIIEGDASAWSYASFSVSAPEVPEVDIQTSEESSNSVVITWTAETNQTYILEISLTEDFSEHHKRVENWDGDEYLLDDLEAGATYYIRVKAVNDDVESEWSEVRVFTPTFVTSAEIDFAGDAISVYPNPARGNFVIQLPSGSGVDNLEIRDVRGQLIRFMSHNDWDTRANVDAANFPPGVYIILFRSNGKIVAERRLIRQ